MKTEQIKWNKLTASDQVAYINGQRASLTRRYVGDLGYSCWHLEIGGVAIGRRETIKEAKKLAVAV